MIKKLSVTFKFIKYVVKSTQIMIVDPPHPHHVIIFDQQPRFVARLHFNRVQVEGAIHQLRLLQSQADAMRYHLNLRHHHHHHHRHH